MKRVLITIGFSAALLLGLVSTAAGATLDPGTPGAVGYLIAPWTGNDQLYLVPQTTYIDYLCDGMAPCLALSVAAPQTTYVDYLCDGMAPCLALNTSRIASEPSVTVYETLDPEAPATFGYLTAPSVGPALRFYDWPWCAEEPCDY